MANPTIRFKRGTQSAFGSVGLNTGEPAFITDEFNFYVGLDGTNGNNKFFGSSRYWIKENATNSLQLTLVNKDGSASNSIRLKSPDAHTGITTYTLPSTPVNTYVLTTNADGVLSWTNAIPGGTFTGITTFTDTTDNTLGDENTGSVQLDGGMGIAKNLTVKQNLHVGGYSEFVGVVTFRGGTINLGDGNTDDINVAGEFVSNLIPNTDDTYDIGNAQRWRNANFSGIVTATTFSGAATQVQTVQNSTNASFYPTFVDSDNVSATGESVYTDAGISYNPSSNTLTVGNIIFDGGGGSITGIASTAAQVETVTAGDNAASYYLTFVDSHNATATAETVYTDSSIYYNPSTNTLTVANLTVDGTTTQVNTTSITVEDTLIELAKVDGSAPSSDVNKDVGLLLHYYDTAARLGAVYWDDSASRIVLASRVGESSGVLTVDSGYYADVEFKGLYITDTAGSAEAVVSYATIGGVTGRHLQNIIVDGGTF